MKKTRGQKTRETIPLSKQGVVSSYFGLRVLLLWCLKFYFISKRMCLTLFYRSRYNFISFYKSKINALCVARLSWCKGLPDVTCSGGAYSKIKGTVARDFWPLVFFMNRPHMGP